MNSGKGKSLRGRKIFLGKENNSGGRKNHLNDTTSIVAHRATENTRNGSEVISEEVDREKEGKNKFFYRPLSKST